MHAAVQYNSNNWVDFLNRVLNYMYKFYIFVIQTLCKFTIDFFFFVKVFILEKKKSRKKSLTILGLFNDFQVCVFTLNP